MAAAHELSPALGAGAACRAMGLWRGAPARQQAQLHRRALVGPPAPRSPRPGPPLALDAQERQTLLDTLNSERFADTAPAAVHATLLDDPRRAALRAAGARRLHFLAVRSLNGLPGGDIADKLGELERIAGALGFSCHARILARSSIGRITPYNQTKSLPT